MAGSAPHASPSLQEGVRVRSSCLSFTASSAACLLALLAQPQVGAVELHPGSALSGLAFCISQTYYTVSNDIYSLRTCKHSFLPFQ